MITITFYVQHLYYWPHFEPLIEAAGDDFAFSAVFAQKPDAATQEYLDRKKIKNKVLAETDNILEALKSEKSNWYLFGNAFEEASELNLKAKTGLIQHGIGPKSVYYTVSDSDISYRFVESQSRLEKLRALFPSKKFILSGYTKLDPFVNGLRTSINLEELNLDSNKKTILYAPTFYPSTIESFEKNWPENYSEYNIIIKPHFFSYVKKRYKKQRELLNQWSNYNNVYLVPIDKQSLLPYMDIADILVSEASSSMFEFAALDKPVMICNFVRLRWSYKGIFKGRFASRMDADFEKYKDIGVVVKQYKDLKPLLDEQINNPTDKAKYRKKFTEELVGRVDGKASKRILDYIRSKKL